jgi:predicted DNA-binding transcriptional regulator AlpA
MIRLSEWCLLTGTPQATAYKLAASGKIPGLIRIGNTIRISTAALTEQIAAAQPAAGTQA